MKNRRSPLSLGYSFWCTLLLVLFVCIGLTGMGCGAADTSVAAHEGGRFAGPNGKSSDWGRNSGGGGGQGAASDAGTTGNQNTGAPNKSWGSNVGTGGAQDIGQFRKILKEGGIPHPNVLDANGFFSEHHTKLPAPNCGKLFCLHGMLARNRSYFDGRKFTVLQLGLNSAKDISKLPRLPLNLVVVIDVSGSMGSQNKLNYVKDGLTLLVDELKEKDLLTIITYSSRAKVLRAPAVVKDKNAVKLLIHNLRASGGTNFYDGLEYGFKEVLKNFSGKVQNRVIMLSDGQPSAGKTGLKDIVAMSDSYVKRGVGLTTIGVGRSFNVQLMRRLAESGSGNYYFLDSREAIREVFQDEMSYFVVPIAYDLRISVKVGDKFKFAETLGTTLWQSTKEGGNLFIPSVFLTGRTSHKDPKAGSGKGRRGGGSAIMVRLDELKKLMEGQKTKVAELKIQYRPAEGEKDETQTLTVDYTMQNQHALNGFFSHKAIEKNYTMLNLFLGFRAACQKAVLNKDMDDALKLLLQLEKEVKAWNKVYNDEDIKADLELVGLFIKNLKTKGAK